MMMTFSEHSKKKTLKALLIILGLSGFFSFLFILTTGLIYFKESDYSRFTKEGVGLIELNGIILDSKKTLKHLEAFEKDRQVRSVVLRLNSPGGSVAPSQEIYEAVKNYPKPIVISMGSLAASGAYYIAVGGKKIFANPGTLTGSIGVIMEFINLEKLYQWAKINRYSIKTGKFKDAGSDYREMTKEEKDLFQAVLDDVLFQFKDAILKGRPLLSKEKISEIADGRIFSGNQAKQLGLIDELGTLQNAVQEAGRLGGISGAPYVIEVKKKKKGLLNLLLQDSDEPWEEARGQVTPIARFLIRFFFSSFESLSDAGSRTEESLSQTEFLPGLYLLWGRR